MDRLVVIMGLPGSGKSTLVERISSRLRCLPYDTDATIPKRLKEKMRKGELVTDKEREEYYKTVVGDISKLLKRGPVIAGLALFREKHRQMFFEKFPGTVFIQLEAPIEVLEKRIRERGKHFFKAELLRKLKDRHEDIHVKHHVVRADRRIEEVEREIETILKRYGL